MFGLLAPILCLLAGALLAALLVPAARRDGAEWLSLALGLGLVLLAGLTLVGLASMLALAVVAGLALLMLPVALFVIHQRDGVPFVPNSRKPDSTDTEDESSPPAMPSSSRQRHRLVLLVLALILLLAAGLRLIHLGYAEYQGDEARAMLLAARLSESHDLSTLLWHKKGPLEVVLPAAAVSLGDVRESSARLPFALAGLGVVLAGFALGRRLWGSRAGLLAAGLLALDGYLVAFSRIVQYQSVVALCSVLAVWAAWRWYSVRQGGAVFLWLAALFLGFGTWAHYEAVFAALPVAYLVVRQARAERWSGRDWLRRLTGPLLLLAGVVALFYVPFVLHPQFAETLRYITERRVGGGGPYNMLPDFFLRASFYNASYYVVAMLIALLAVVCWLCWRALSDPREVVVDAEGQAVAKGRSVRRVWPALVTLGLLGLAAAAILQPSLFAVADRSWAILVFLPLFGIPLLSGRIDVRWKLLLLWFAGPFLVASFLVQKPHTHFYTMIPAWTLLVGAGADQALGQLARGRMARPARVLAGLAAAGFVLVCGWYAWTVFVRHDPEYKRVFPEAALPGYWLPYGDEPPRGGYFGFPYRAGWNEVRALFADGTLQGSYDSNEELLITGWYTGGAVRCADNPRYYLVAWRPQDEEEIPDRAELERTHHLKATIRVDGQDKLWVYDREPVLGEPLVIDDSGGLASMGGEASSFVNRPLPVSQALEWPLTQWPADVRFDEALRLRGVDVVGLAAGEPGTPPILPYGVDSLGVVLAWEPVAPVERNYEMALVIQGQTGQGPPHVETPMCGGGSTEDWQPGERVFDGHTVPFYREVLGPGDYRLSLLLMDRTNERPAEARPAGAVTPTKQVPLMTFRVEEP
jgi:4-amino-4-deoxy-L-arabinose transferase-like glycosyltransferase